MNTTTITNASVRVMHSHDYCHFEVTLGTCYAITPEEVDELRKVAARLADKAVEQYKIAKEAVSRRLNAGYGLPRLAADAAKVEAKPENERTPEEQAILKAFGNALHASRRSYDYEDDWQDERDEDYEDQGY